MALRLQLELLADAELWDGAVGPADGLMRGGPVAVQRGGPPGVISVQYQGPGLVAEGQGGWPRPGEGLRLCWFLLARA